MAQSGWGVSTADFFKWVEGELICLRLRNGDRREGYLRGVDARSVVIEQPGQDLPVLVTWHAIEQIEARVYTDATQAEKTHARLRKRAGRLYRR